MKVIHGNIVKIKVYVHALKVIKYVQGHTIQDLLLVILFKDCGV